MRRRRARGDGERRWIRRSVGMTRTSLVRAEGELAAEVEALLAAGHLPVPFAGLGEDSGLRLPSLDRAGTVRTAEMRLRK